MWERREREQGRAREAERREVRLSWRQNDEVTSHRMDGRGEIQREIEQ